MEVTDLQRKVVQNPLISLDHAQIALSTKDKQELSTAFLQGLPFAYLLGESEFFGHKFFVNKDVLIPRPETEQLVDHILRSGKEFNTLLDVGTGSGVILLSLLKERSGVQGIGSDFSSQALVIAEANARRLSLPQARFILSDRLQNISQCFDLIVSNPPYIKAISHRSLVHQKVDEFEPSTALYLPEDLYEEWFSQFFNQVKNHLNPQGEFWMEGHELELQKQASMLESLSFNHVQVLKDWSGVDRFLHAH